MIHAVDRRAELAELAVTDAAVHVDVHRDASADPAPEPDLVALVRIGMVSTWDFDRADPVAAPTRR